MRQASSLIAGGILALALAAPALAVGVRVEVIGTVEYNVIPGELTGIQAGARAVMSFNLDSTNFLNSEFYPTRGYRIDLSSFDLNIGGVHMRLDNPQPEASEALFVLRDNDPGVDGFFISPGPDYRYPLSLHIPGLAPAHELEFGRTFDVNTTLHSLNILDAVGFYGFENMSSYQWTIGRFGNPGLEISYESIGISAVPEPTTWSLFGLGVLSLLVGVRRSPK